MNVETGDSTARVRSSIPPPTLSQNMRSRPTSLVPLAPEKEALGFSINLTGAPPEVEHLIEHIKVVAEQFLYHWKTFPIGELKCNK